MPEKKVQVIFNYSFFSVADFVSLGTSFRFLLLSMKLLINLWPVTVSAWPVVRLFFIEARPGPSPCRPGLFGVA